MPLKPFEQLSYHGQGRRLRAMAETALASYELLPARITLMTHRHDTTFRIVTEDGQRFVLRMYNAKRRDKAMHHSELQWLAALRHETELIVPEPVATKSNELIAELASNGSNGGDGLAETRYYALSRWVEGRFLHTSLTPAQFAQVGMLTGTLHQHARHFTPPDGFTRTQWQWQWVFEDSTELAQQGTPLISPETFALVNAAYDKIRAQMQALPPTKEHYGLVHFDLQHTNYLFHHGNVRAIDFGDCCWNYYLFDMVIPLFDVADRADEATMRAAFFRGYERILPLPAHHETYLPLFRLIRLLKRMNYLVNSVDNPAHLALVPQWVDYTTQHLRAYLQ